MPCALRKLDWVELLVPIEISRLYAEKLCEFKVELKLEKLCDADGVVCTHGKVGLADFCGLAAGQEDSLLDVSRL